MKIKIDFGTATEIPEHTLQEIISTGLATVRRHGLKCCKATIFLNEYDDDGRLSCLEYSANNGTQDRFEEGLLLRNRRYSRNENTGLR